MSEYNYTVIEENSGLKEVIKAVNKNNERLKWALEHIDEDNLTDKFINDNGVK